jgi:Cu-Zn family superoxide dismutase
MTPRALSLLLALAAPLAADAGAPARAVMKNAQGSEIGRATFTATEGGVQVHVEVTNLPPGKHGIHLHEAARCEPPDFASAGVHFNPFGKKHGLRNPEGAHVGDMSNLTVAEDGKAKATFTARGATLREGQGSILGGRGTALVIHAAPDDEKTDPTGNSGARIACGVVERK